MMRSKFIRMSLLAAFSLLMSQSILSAAGAPILGRQSGSPDDQKYAGLWVGTYQTDSGAKGDLSYEFRKDAKGQWTGIIKFTTDDGPQKADFRSIQITDGKLKGQIEDPEGQVDIAIEGQFQADKFEGSYSVSPKGTTEVVDKGTWTVTRTKAAQ